MTLATLRTWQPPGFWMRANLAQRISLMSSLVATLVLVLTLSLSYVALHSMILNNIEGQMRAASSTVLARFESRLEAITSTVRNTSTQAILSNALADSAERAFYIRPMLIELCVNQPHLVTLELSDFNGVPLVDGCKYGLTDSTERQALLRTAIEAEALTQTLHRRNDALRLFISAPITYLPTDSLEGALGAEIDLDDLFNEAVQPEDPSYAFKLLIAEGSDVMPGTLQVSNARLSYVRPLSVASAAPLQLGIEVSIDTATAYKPLMWLVMGFILIGTVVFLLTQLISRLLARHIAAPLAELEATACRVAAGDFDNLPPPPQAEGEQDHFRKLAASVYHMIAALKQSHEHLSTTLEQRTSEVERVEADRLLKERALASSQSGILILQLQPDEAQRVIYANAALYRITGLDEGKVIGARWPDVLLPAARVVELVHGHHGRDACEQIQVSAQRPDGTRAELELSISAVSAAGAERESHAIVVVNDITARVRDNLAHRARLERLREVIFEIDLEGRCTFLNSSWERISGHPVSESLGRILARYMHPDDLERELPQLDAMREQRQDACQFEARLLTRTGETRWVMADVTTAEDEHGEVIGFTGTLVDITERHEASMAITLRDRALQAASNGIVITDLNAPDNPVIYANPAFENITGYPLTEVIGRNCRFLHSRDPNQPELLQLRAAIKARESCQVTLRNYRKDGSEYWNELAISPITHPVSGEATHYVGVQTDVTARKESEDLLIEWLSRLDAVFILSPDAVICFDENNMLSYANPTAERMFGTSIGALKHMSLEAFYAYVQQLGDPGQLFPDMPAAITLGDSARNDHTLLHMLQPRPCILQQTHRHCGGTSTGLVLYFRDVTREFELDRMKSEFLSTAAHELRSPMASIMGFSELLMMRKYDEARTQDLLATINRQAKRLTALLTDLLDLARIEARRSEGLKFETLPLRTLIDDVLSAFMMPEDPRSVTLDIPAELPCVRADRAKFQQSLINLLSNAYKFSPEGGEIRLSVTPTHPEGKALIGIAVRDQGIGMAPEEARHAFERFYRSDRSGHIPGTGLGLSLVKEILQVHGGEVSLESTAGVGTCVTLWFPVASSRIRLAEVEPV